MRTQFENWMKSYEKKKQNTAYAYANSIDKISQHYFKQTGQKIDIYSLKEIKQIRDISGDYSTSGRFNKFGYEGNGTIRNAIATYLRFYTSLQTGQEIHSPQHFNNNVENSEFAEIKKEDESTEHCYNFTYERDLQNSLINQAEELFPNYKIYGHNLEGVEFTIGGKRIDVLLEHKTDKSLLAVEIKSGIADFKVFGQISMYLGLLAEQFPEKNINGVIVAGEIDKSLISACAITDKVNLKTYKMQLTIEDAN